jgi:hypothetical protein
MSFRMDVDSDDSGCIVLSSSGNERASSSELEDPDADDTSHDKKISYRVVDADVVGKIQVCEATRLPETRLCNELRELGIVAWLEACRCRCALDDMARGPEAAPRCVR